MTSLLVDTSVLLLVVVVPSNPVQYGVVPSQILVVWSTPYVCYLIE